MEGKKLYNLCVDIKIGNVLNFELYLNEKNLMSKLASHQQWSRGVSQQDR